MNTREICLNDEYDKLGLITFCYPVSIFPGSAFLSFGFIVL